MKMKDEEVLMSVSVVFKKKGKEFVWFLVKQGDSQDWELPRTIARRGESSVRASIRLMGEQGGMRARIFEELDRHIGAGKINDRVVTQKTLYYIMENLGSGEEPLAFVESEWLPAEKAVKKLKNAREIKVLKEASKMVQVLKKAGRLKRPPVVVEEVKVE